MNRSLIPRRVRRGGRTIWSLNDFGPQTRRWVLNESWRRSRLRFGMGTRCSTALLSFPKSGNHAVRTFLEYLSGRPTLGEGDSEDFIVPGWLVDRPIFLRSGMSIPISDSRPIAVKRHWSTQEAFSRWLLIVRDPVDLAFRNRDVDLDGSLDEREAHEHVGAWMKLLKLPLKSSAIDFLGISYGDVLGGDERAFRSIAEFLDVPADTHRLVDAIQFMKSHGPQAQADSKSSAPASVPDTRKHFPKDLIVLTGALVDEGYFDETNWYPWKLPVPLLPESHSP